MLPASLPLPQSVGMGMGSGKRLLGPPGSREMGVPGSVGGRFGEAPAEAVSLLSDAEPPRLPEQPRGGYPRVVVKVGGLPPSETLPGTGTRARHHRGSSHPWFPSFLPLSLPSSPKPRFSFLHQISHQPQPSGLPVSRVLQARLPMGSHGEIKAFRLFEDKSLAGKATYGLVENAILSVRSSRVSSFFFLGIPSIETLPSHGAGGCLGQTRIMSSGKQREKYFQNTSPIVLLFLSCC